MNQSFNGEGMTPELTIECAKKAYPEFIWREDDGKILGALRKSIEALGDSIRYMAPEQVAPYFGAKFDMNSGNCGMALQIALEKDGWDISTPVKSVDGHDYWCAKHYAIHDVTADTKKQLLLACVAAMHSLDLQGKV